MQSDTNPLASDVTPLASDAQVASDAAASVTSSADHGMKFNEDVQCAPHDNLVLEESERRLIPADLWQRLKWYFPGAPEYPGQIEACPKCAVRLGLNFLYSRYMYTQSLQ